MDRLPNKLFQFFLFGFLINLSGLIGRVFVVGFQDIVAIILTLLLIFNIGCLFGSLLACLNFSAKTLPKNSQKNKKKENELEEIDRPTPFAILAEDEAPEAIILNEYCQNKIQELKKKFFAVSVEELVQGALHVLDDLAGQIKNGHRVIVVGEIANLDENNLPDIELYKIKEIVLGVLQRFRDDEEKDSTEPCFRIVPKHKVKMT